MGDMVSDVMRIHCNTDSVAELVKRLQADQKRALRTMLAAKRRRTITALLDRIPSDYKAEAYAVLIRILIDVLRGQKRG